MVMMAMLMVVMMVVMIIVVVVVAIMVVIMVLVAMMVVMMVVAVALELELLPRCCSHLSPPFPLCPPAPLEVGVAHSTSSLCYPFDQ